MTFQIFLQQQPESGYVASVIGIPNCVAEAETREDAVAKVTEALNQLIAKGELITVDLKNGVQTEANNPWLKIIGMFEDDPTWDDFQANIEEYRRELDAEEAARNQAS